MGFEPTARSSSSVVVRQRPPCAQKAHRESTDIHRYTVSSSGSAVNSGFSRNFRESGGTQDALTQQIKLGSAIHTAFDQFFAAIDTFTRSLSSSVCASCFSSRLTSRPFKQVRGLPSLFCRPFTASRLTYSGEGPFFYRSTRFTHTGA